MIPGQRLGKDFYICFAICMFIGIFDLLVSINVMGLENVENWVLMSVAMMFIEYILFLIYFLLTIDADPGNLDIQNKNKGGKK